MTDHTEDDEVEAQTGCYAVVFLAPKTPEEIAHDGEGSLPDWGHVIAPFLRAEDAKRCTEQLQAEHPNATVTWRTMLDPRAFGY